MPLDRETFQGRVEFFLWKQGLKSLPCIKCREFRLQKTVLRCDYIYTKGCKTLEGWFDNCPKWGGSVKYIKVIGEILDDFTHPQ